MKNIRYILSLLILHFCFYINQIIASNVDTTGIKSDNYIRSMTYMNESGSLFTDQITYSDGLGRLFQTIQSRITPTFHDLVTLYTYDGYGRESEVWLPFISSENGKTIAPDYLMAQLKLQYNDTHPYSRTEYELSPLERIVRVVNPGQEWSINDKSLKTEYLLADATSNELKVASFELTTNAKGNPKLSASFIVPFYHGMHRVLRVIDEDNNVSYEFKDAKNQTILVRNIVNGNNVDTYFVYDYSGNLCYVLPPALTDHLLTKIMTAVDASDAQWTSDDPFIYKYAYIYEYDALNRCIAKKLPGCEWIYYVYDKADHLIFSQDGEQRKRGEWEFNIPDVFGRMVLNGLVKTINGGDITVGLFDSHLIEAEFSTSGTYYGYNLKLDGNVLALSVYKILKAAYYDNYAFRGLVGFSNSNLAYKTAGVDDFYLKRYGDDNPATGYKHKNLLTGTFTALLDESNTLLYSCMYYDNEQRLIQTRSINHLPGGLEEEYIAYNFKGQPTRRQHIHSATGKATQTETYAYEYDHAGRLLTTKHRLNAGTEVTLADNEYDELGRLKSNKRNGLSNLASSYTYNIRSWLKSSSSPLFNQTLYYNDTYAGSTARYNGNISAMSWKMSNEIPTRGYKFSYDNL
ncbi:RHS repeat-associated core domain-containing protein, partial [Bacteroidaceae bacterium HV4-6-C5C]